MEVNEKNKQVWHEIIIECFRIYKPQREALLAYTKNYKKSRKNLAIFLLSRRILSNICAIAELAGLSYKKDGSLFFKLPVGLLLRNCLTDCITALYLLKLDDQTVEKTMELWNVDYTKALLEQFEVYRDKISFANFSDELAEHMYTLSIEDNFLHYLDINDEYKEVKPGDERHIWKVKKRKEYLPNGTNEDPNMRNMAKALSKDNQFGSCANSLFAYYKYFSQWEHFSENGTGDILANYGEDNIKIPMTFCHINQALNFLLRKK